MIKNNVVNEYKDVLKKKEFLLLAIVIPRTLLSRRIQLQKKKINDFTHLKYLFDHSMRKPKASIPAKRSDCNVCLLGIIYLQIFHLTSLCLWIMYGFHLLKSKYLLIIE